VSFRNDLLVSQENRLLDELEIAYICRSIRRGKLLAYGAVEFVEEFLVFIFALFTISFDSLLSIILPEETKNIVSSVSIVQQIL